MAAREYPCILRRLRTPLFGSPRWEEISNPLPVPINLASMPSKMNALLDAIDRYGNANSRIGDYELCVLDDDGNVFHTIQATSDQLRLHRNGYRVNVADGTAPGSLAGYSDEQLIAELRRRLADRAVGPGNSASR